MQARAYNGEFTPPDTETETDKNALYRIVVHNPLSSVHILADLYRSRHRVV